MLDDLIISVQEPGADEERLDALSRVLGDDLRMPDVEVDPLRIGQAPEGTRALDIVEAGSLLVSISGSLAAAEAILSRIRAWLGRGPKDRSVKVTIGGRAIELTAATDSEQAALVRAFLDSAEGDDDRQ